MPRYLLYFSYIGTHFLGSQRLLLSNKKADFNTVQGLLEGALTLVWIKFQQDLPRRVRVKLSSRTDAKVHAFVNTAHFDMSGEQKGNPLTPEVITRAMNKAIRDLRKYQDLCILKIRIVPNDFHCRFNVVSRSYMYRLAVASSDSDLSHCSLHKYQPLLPLVEQCRCHVVPSSQFDFEAFNAAMQLYRGTHNFARFMASPSHGPPLERCVKQVDLQVVPGQSFLNRCYDPLYEKLRFYEIHLQSRSFLHRQVRNMVGAAIAVGDGSMSYEKLRFMIDYPKECITNDSFNVHPVPADALFLTDVLYNSSDLELPDTYSETRRHEE